jgi:hypothetical protein
MNGRWKLKTLRNLHNRDLNGAVNLESREKEEGERGRERKRERKKEKESSLMIWITLAFFASTLSSSSSKF